MKKSTGYFKKKWPDTLKGWTVTWFYCIKPSTMAGLAALPPCLHALDEWHNGWSLKLS